MDFGEANALRLDGAKPFHAACRRDALGGDVVAIEKQIAVISFDFRDERFHIGARRRCAGARKSSADGAENEQKRRYVGKVLHKIRLNAVAKTEKAPGEAMDFRGRA